MKFLIDDDFSFKQAMAMTDNAINCQLECEFHCK